MTKPYQPKLGTARPRLSAALQAAPLQQNLQQTIPQQKIDNLKQPKKKSTAQALMNLVGQF